jgi:signal transduction histidine kinase
VPGEERDVQQATSGDERADLAREGDFQPLDRLRELVSINRAIISSLEYDEVLRLVVEKTAEFTGADACLLLLADAANQARVAAAVNVDPERANRLFAPLDERISTALTECLGFPADEIFRGAPVVRRGQIAGVLAFYARNRERPPGEDEFLLSMLADEAALALDHAELFRELQQANRRKDQFLAVLAHELRNPLGAMSNAVHLLKRHIPDEPLLRRTVATLERQVRHQVHLIDDLLDVSRVTRGKISLQCQRLDLGWLLRQVVEDHRPAVETAELTLTLEIPEEPIWVSADATRVAQVLDNLLSNAAKFTPTGGLVTVSLSVGSGQWAVDSSGNRDDSGASSTSLPTAHCPLIGPLPFLPSATPA